MISRRVLMITTAFPPSTCAGIHRIVRFVRYLPEQGWEACILSEGTSDGITSEEAAEFELPADLTVSRTRALGRSYERRERTDERPASGDAVEPSRAASSGNGRTGRLRSVVRNIRDLSLATPDKDMAWTVATVRKAIEMVRQWKPDVVLTSGPPHSTHLVGMAVKRMTGTPWLADFRDPWARRPWGPKAGNPWGQKLSGRFERQCVRHADGVILNTEPMTDEFRSYYSAYDASRFVTIPNACDPRLTEEVRQIERSPRTCDAGHSAARVRLCHPGSMYRKRDPRPLMEAVGRVCREGIRVEFEQIGACDPRFGLEEFISEHQLQGAVSVGLPVSHAECLRRMADADVFVLIQPGTAIQVPGKLYEMMSFGRPILALADEGATAELIRDHRLGVVARPADVEGIAAAIRESVGRLAELTEPERWERVRRTYDVRRTVELLAHELDRVSRAPSRAEVAGTREPIGSCR